MGKEEEYYTAIENAAKIAKLMSHHSQINFDVLQKLLTRLSPECIISLAEGTCMPHQMMNLIREDELRDCFELIQSGEITIPSEDDIHKEIFFHRMVNLSELELPEGFEPGNCFFVKVFKLKKSLTNQSCVDFALLEKAYFTRMAGLGIARMKLLLDGSMYYYGIDKKCNLPTRDGGHTSVPYLSFDNDERDRSHPVYSVCDWFQTIREGSCIILYYDV